MHPHGDICVCIRLLPNQYQAVHPKATACTLHGCHMHVSARPFCRLNTSQILIKVIMLFFRHCAFQRNMLVQIFFSLQVLTDGNAWLITMLTAQLVEGLVNQAVDNLRK